jgi:hypothetical protein
MEYLRIDEVAALLEVDASVLEDFVTELERTKEIATRGEKLVLFDALLKLQSKDPTFGGRKSVEREVLAPASLARRGIERRDVIIAGLGAVGLTTFGLGGVLNSGIGGLLRDTIAEYKKEHDDATEAQELFDGLFGIRTGHLTLEGSTRQDNITKTIWRRVTRF